MNKKSLLPAALMAAVLAGCSGDSTTPAQDAKFKAQLSQQHIDMSQVPQERRQMVQGYIDRARAAGAASKDAGKKAGQ